MRRNSLSINYSIKTHKSQSMLMLFAILFSFLLITILPTHTAVAKNVQDFYFDSFEADYYLTKDEEGISRLKVKETFVAIFPNYNQNKGLCRRIPYTSNGGKNLTIERMTKDDIRVTRNGLTEPIYSIEKTDDDEYEVCTGTENMSLASSRILLNMNFRM